jgi:hypothetical protein
MTDQQKTDLILFAAICGYLTEGILQLGMKDQEIIKAQELGKQGLELFESVVNRLPSTDCKKLLKCTKTCEIAVIPPDKVKKRVGEKELTVKRENLDELAEQALTFCETCTRDYKRCALRKTFKKLEVAPCHDETGKCEFKA